MLCLVDETYFLNVKENCLGFFFNRGQMMPFLTEEHKLGDRVEMCLGERWGRDTEDTVAGEPAGQR